MPKKGAREESRKLRRVPDQLKDFDTANWDRCCRRMQLEIAAGSVDRAFELLQVFVANSKPEALTLDSPIWMLDALPHRTLAMLEEEGYTTIRSLACARPEELLEIKWLNRLTLNSIRDAVRDALQQASRANLRDRY